MDLVLVYALFAFTTGFAALYELIQPTLNKLAVIDPTHNMVEHPILSTVTFFIMAVMLAPPVFICCIVPSWGEKFRESMLTTLLVKKI